MLEHLEDILENTADDYLEQARWVQEQQRHFADSGDWARAAHLAGEVVELKRKAREVRADG